MTRPRLTSGKGGTVLWVRVQPRARREGIEGLHGDLLKVALTAPPVDGAANEALCRFLAEAFGLAPSRIQVVVGRSSREKGVQLGGLDLPAVEARLAGLLPEPPA